MTLMKSLAVAIILLAAVTFALGVTNIAVTCSQIILKCIVSPVSDTPTFLFMTYTGVAIWASVLIGATGIFAVRASKQRKNLLACLATLTFLSFAVFDPAIIAINGVEAYYFQTLYPVANYTFGANDPNLVKFSINVATSAVGLIVFIPLFVLFVHIYCRPKRTVPANKKKVSAITKPDQQKPTATLPDKPQQPDVAIVQPQAVQPQIVQREVVPIQPTYVGYYGYNTPYYAPYTSNYYYRTPYAQARYLPRQPLYYGRY